MFPLHSLLLWVALCVQADSENSEQFPKTLKLHTILKVALINILISIMYRMTKCSVKGVAHIQRIISQLYSTLYFGFSL